MNPDQEAYTVVASPDDALLQRLQDLATFANGIAHDVRNPLSVIRTNTYLLRQGPAGQDPKTGRAFQRIEEQVDVALHLLNGIQAFDRARQPNPQRVNLNELVRSVLSTTLIPEAWETRLDLAEDLPLLTADPQLLDAALRAILRNCQEAGSVSALHVVTSQAGNGVRLEVSDNGPGIPEDELPHVFEPFRSTRRAHGGVGLTLVAVVAKVHGGQASISSRPGEGTRVLVDLPLEG